MAILNRRIEPKINRQGKNNRVFYNSHRWHEYSRQYRKKNRLCITCLDKGLTVLSQCVDHIVRIEEGGDMWNPNNHQALCTACHSIKTKQERKNTSRYDA
jgi:5-methylcytosine-specific restriction protein A